MGRALAQLVREMRPEKQVTLKLGRPVTRTELECAGARVLALSESEAKLQVPQGQLQSAVFALLSQWRVVDLTVEDAPLEEVLSDLFARARP